MYKTKEIDELKVKIYPSRKEMGKDAAKDFTEHLVELLAQKEYVNIIFAAAPSQLDFLGALKEKKEIDWKRVRVFHMDEYVGLGIEAKQSFAGFVKKYVVDALGAGEYYPLNGLAKDVEDEKRRYTALLKKYPTDIVCLGIGENGHIAFNDPGVAQFDDSEAVKIATLDGVCRQQQVNDKCFDRIEDVPKTALTLTVPTLMAGERLFCIVPTKNKANAVRDVLLGTITENCPASILRKHKNCTLYLDEESASLL